MAYNVLARQGRRRHTHHTPVVLTEIDYQVSEMMMQMWTQFTKMGDPNVAG